MHSNLEHDPVGVKMWGKATILNPSEETLVSEGSKQYQKVPGQVHSGNVQLVR